MGAVYNLTGTLSPGEVLEKIGKIMRVVLLTGFATTAFRKSNRLGVYNFSLEVTHRHQWIFLKGLNGKLEGNFFWAETTGGY